MLAMSVDTDVVNVKSVEATEEDKGDVVVVEVVVLAVSVDADVVDVVKVRCNESALSKLMTI